MSGTRCTNDKHVPKLYSIADNMDPGVLIKLNKMPLIAHARPLNVLHCPRVKILIIFLVIFNSGRMSLWKVREWGTDIRG